MFVILNKNKKIKFIFNKQNFKFLKHIIIIFILLYGIHNINGDKNEIYSNKSNRRNN